MTTLERLQELLVKDYKLDAAVLTPEAPFETLGFDSLGMAELLFNVEDEFGIKLPSEPVALVTIADAARFIDHLISAQRVSATQGTGGTGGADATTTSSTTV